LLNPELLNPNTLIEEVRGTLQPLLRENITFATELDPSLGLVRADSVQFQRVLLNLALNAQDAMPDGGNLTVSSSNVELDDNRASRLSRIPPGQYVLLSIKDTGVGMSEEAQAHLFEPFFTTKEWSKGGGLGLSTVYGIIQQSGGHIAVETELGGGTTFQIFLPRILPEA
jgi:signal transduction histidine kinase